MYPRRALISATVAALLSLSACGPRALDRLPADASDNARRYAQECDGGDADACYYVGIMWHLGPVTSQNVPHDPERAMQLFRYACRKGSAEACAAIENPPVPGTPMAP